MPDGFALVLAGVKRAVHSAQSGLCIRDSIHSMLNLALNPATLEVTRQFIQVEHIQSCCGTLVSFDCVCTCLICRNECTRIELHDSISQMYTCIYVCTSFAQTRGEARAFAWKNKGRAKANRRIDSTRSRTSAKQNMKQSRAVTSQV
jgi:hypothetical protein